MWTYLGMLLRLRRGERGASAVEYGLLIAGVALVLVIAAPTIRDTLGLVFDQSNSGLETTPGTNTTN